MSSSSYRKVAQVQNLTGGTIQYWVEHRPKSGSSTVDTGYGNGLGNGDSGATFGIQLEKNTEDNWVVSWTDGSQNLYSTSFFNATINSSMGSEVLIEVRQDSVKISQGTHQNGASVPSKIGVSSNTAV